MKTEEAKAIVGRFLALMQPLVHGDKLLDFVTGFTGGLDIALDDMESASRLRDALVAVLTPGDYKSFPSDALHFIVTGEG